MRAPPLVQFSAWVLLLKPRRRELASETAYVGGSAICGEENSTEYRIALAIRVTMYRRVAIGDLRLGS